MRKLCGICERNGPLVTALLRSPTISLDGLIEVLSKHCGSHTKTTIAPIICSGCLFEYLMDSQWSTGWLGRTDFLYNVIMKMYHTDNLSPARKKALRSVYKLGTSALSEMCIKCNINSDFDLERKAMPSWLLKANDDLLSQYVPRKYYKDYGNALCGKCAREYEMAFIKAIPKEDLPLHINDKWLFKAEALFDKRLKEGK